MPKVYIEGERVYKEETHEDGKKSASIERGPRARVSWSKEGEYLQIATVEDDGVVLEPTPEGNGWFVTLDRKGANDLIRALRRARDGAFGADA